MHKPRIELGTLTMLGLHAATAPFVPVIVYLNAMNVQMKYVAFKFFDVMTQLLRCILTGGGEQKGMKNNKIRKPRIELGTLTV